jgi:hypothetical protein
VLANILLPGHVCEVQLHLQAIYEVKSEVGHRVYKWYRRLADGGAADATTPSSGMVLETSQSEGVLLNTKQSPTRRLSATGRQQGPKDELGRLHGNGCTCIAPNGDKSEGQMKHGQLHGQGKYKYADGDIFEGEFSEDEFVRGTYRCSNGNAYEGEMSGSDWHGEGTLVETDGDIKDGKWDKSRFMGGKWTMGKNRGGFPPGAVYEGVVKGKKGASLPEGHGKLTVGDGVWEGAFVGGRMNGQGTLTKAGKLVFEGEWVNHTRRKGTYNDKSGGVIVGEFNEKGMPHGQVEATQANGVVVKGEWKDGRPWVCEVLQSGKAVAVYKDGQQQVPPAEQMG